MEVALLQLRGSNPFPKIYRETPMKIPRHASNKQTNKHVAERMFVKEKCKIHQDHRRIESMQNPSNPISFMPYRSPFVLSPHLRCISWSSQPGCYSPTNLEAPCAQKRYGPTILLIRFYHHSATSGKTKNHITVTRFQALHLPGSYCQIQCQTEN